MPRAAPPLAASILIENIETCVPAQVLRHVARHPHQSPRVRIEVILSIRNEFFRALADLPVLCPGRTDQGDPSFGQSIGHQTNDPAMFIQLAGAEFGTRKMGAPRLVSYIIAGGQLSCPGTLTLRGRIYGPIDSTA